MDNFRPMLAVNAGKEIKFPVYASYKLDGVRATVVDRQLLSRSLKPIRNKFVQDYFSTQGLALDGLDGELIVGEPNDKNAMQNTTSGVMSAKGEPDFTFWLFDCVLMYPYNIRLDYMQTAFRNPTILSSMVRIKLLPQVLIHNQSELDAFEAEALQLGYEGVMIRSPDGIYKFGRSTVKEGYLLKVKRFADGEAVVTGLEELMHNGNESTVNELGYTARSSNAEGKVPMGTMGSLLVRDLVTGIDFGIGTGYNALQRSQIWDLHSRGGLLGRIVKYKHFEIGVKDAPRFPVFQGFRDSLDMDFKQ